MNSCTDFISKNKCEQFVLKTVRIPNARNLYYATKKSLRSWKKFETIQFLKMEKVHYRILQSKINLFFEVIITLDDMLTEWLSTYRL